MREILFRGKTDKGEWVVGLPTRKHPFDKKINRIQLLDDYYENDITEFFYVKNVIPETVGQYTGLTDKNGKKIFEGDIVKCTDEFSHYEFIAVVMFGNPNGEYNWGFQLKRISGATANTDILLWVEMEETGAFTEVIGNIHDNPELLKGE